MKKFFVLMISLFFVLGLFTGCDEDSPTKSEAPPTATALFVLNSSATSISVVDLETGTVYNDAATVGTWPNQIVYIGGKLYCVNSGSNNIMVFNPDTWAIETISLGPNNNPMNMAFYDENTAYVACSVSNKVLKIDLAAKAVTKTIDAGVGATGIAIADGKVYVANTAFNGSNYTYGQGTVTVVDAATGNFIKTLNVATNPQAVGVTSDGMINVVCTGDYFSQFGKIAIINPATNTVVDSIEVGNSPGSISISHSDDMAYLGIWGAGILSYNTSTKVIENGSDDLLLGKGGSGVVTDTEGNIFVSVWEDDQVVKIDSDGNVLATYNVGDSPLSLTIKVE